VTLTTAQSTQSKTDTFRILVPDKLAAEGLEFINSQPDAEVDSRPGISEAELAEIAGDYDGMIVRSGIKVTAEVMANPGRLKAIARAGVGVDNIDLQAATAKGILVMNSAAASTISTAEHAFPLLMALARNIGPAYKTMAEGGWDRSKFVGTQLHGKTLGVVGFGRIGRTVAERALAFGMKVVAFDPIFNAETALDGQVRIYQDFQKLLPLAEILTFHVPLNNQTRGMLNLEAFEKCKPGVLVVNASRGGVVDEESLLKAVEQGRCGGAALDVYTEEPPPADSPLRNHPKILTTPHLGASTKEAQQAVSIGAAKGLLDYLRGEGVSGAVNAGGLRVDLDPFQWRYLDLATRMAQLISPMISGGISSVHLEFTGDDIAPVARTIERMALISLLRNHLADDLNVVNVAHLAEQRGIKLKSTVIDDERAKEDNKLVMEVRGGGEERRATGRVFDDLRPRVVEINGYHLDMVPAGEMVLLQNDDRPGMIGMVGTEFGKAGVNIADMAISRRDGDDTAFMVFRIDNAAPEELLNWLPKQPGIRKVATVKLPPEPA